MVLDAVLGKIILLSELQPLFLYSRMKPCRTHYYLHKHWHLTIQIQSTVILPPKQSIKLHHLTLLHSSRHFTTPAELHGTIRAQSSETMTWPKAALGITAEQWYLAELKQSRNTSQITCRRWCKAPALHSSHMGTRAMAPVSRDLSTTGEQPCAPENIPYHTTLHKHFPLISLIRVLVSHAPEICGMGNFTVWS